MECRGSMSKQSQKERHLWWQQQVERPNKVRNRSPWRRDVPTLGHTSRAGAGILKGRKAMPSGWHGRAEGEVGRNAMANLVEGRKEGEMDSSAGTVRPSSVKGQTGSNPTFPLTEECQLFGDLDALRYSPGFQKAHAPLLQSLDVSLDALCCYPRRQAAQDQAQCMRSPALRPSKTHEACSVEHAAALDFGQKDPEGDADL